MQTVFDVKGMTCEHCEKTVKNALETLTGVASVDVNLDKGSVHVKYDEKEVTKATLEESIEDQGYEVN